jgi:hypothetical protein
MDITFIPQQTNQKISDTNPKDYFSHLEKTIDDKKFKEILDSHMIPTDEGTGIWSNDYETFLRERASLVRSEIYQLTGKTTTQRINDKKKHVETTERKIRSHIDETLSEHFEDYWKHVPQDIRGNVKHRIKQDRKKNPDLEIETPKERLTYCNVHDYAKIICSNFEAFDEDFPSKSEVQNRLGDFASYRNQVMHNRDLDKFTKRDGETAIDWLRQAIN